MVRRSPEKKYVEQADIRVKWSVEGLKKESEERAEIRVKWSVEGLRKESVEQVDLRVKWSVERLRKECSGLKIKNFGHILLPLKYRGTIVLHGLLLSLFCSPVKYFCYLYF
jgi:hypothetical protein